MTPCMDAMDLYVISHCAELKFSILWGMIAQDQQYKSDIPEVLTQPTLQNCVIGMKKFP